jgi:CHASE3 domain sensor protein
VKTDRIKLLLAVSIALTVMSGIITYYAIRESRARLDWVLHSYKVLKQGNDALAILTNMESSHRGYLLSIV